MNTKLTSDRVVVSDSIEAFNSFMLEKQWSDGLPLIPPTEEAVNRMLTGTGRKPSEVVGVLGPRQGEGTVEKIAINAVMAGCLPEYLPVIITAVEALCQKEFNLEGTQTTTHPNGIMILVNGPVARKLNINSGTGAFGPGWRANATIGRAIRLIIMNIAGVFPGKTTMSTQAQPCRFSYCVAENEAESPWPPFHVERGFSAADSTVTVASAEGPHNIQDHAAETGNDLLITVAGSIAYQGHNNIALQSGDPFIAFGPEHAQSIARDGYSKNDVRDYLWNKARIPRRSFNPAFIKKYYPDLPEDALIPPVARKEDLNLIVVGGPGKHTAFIPSFGGTRSVTRAISEAGV